MFRKESQIQLVGYVADGQRLFPCWMTGYEFCDTLVPMLGLKFAFAKFFLIITQFSELKCLEKCCLKIVGDYALFLRV